VPGLIDSQSAFRLKKSFSLFLALRYLKPKRTFLSIITLVSITGVMLGITVLILVISVMTGFEQELRRKVIGFDAHLLVSEPSTGVLEDWEGVAGELQEIVGVVAVAPFVQGPVLVEFERRRLAPKIRGIDAELEQQVTEIKDFIIAGDLMLDGNQTVIGSELARALGVSVGDTLTVYSPGNIGEVLEEIDRLEQARNAGAGEETTSELENLRQLVLPMDLEVTGIFESGRFLYDSEFLLVPMHIGQELYNLESGVHGVSVKTSAPYAAPEIARTIRGTLNRPLHAMTWIDMNRQLFDAIKMERQVMFFLLMFIILVAAFGIMNTLITVTVQKTREIGIMKALGARTAQIVGVFVFQGMVVGVFGTITGLALGMTLVQFRNEFSQWLAQTLRVEVFPASVYGFTEIPAEVVASDVAIICISAFVICSVAALIPAWFAARLDPVKALRME
jgi:lipoprotein-releasing system permease protein